MFCQFNVMDAEMLDQSGLTDDELRAALHRHGINAGPWITGEMDVSVLVYISMLNMVSDWDQMLIKIYIMKYPQNGIDRFDFSWR